MKSPSINCRQENHPPINHPRPPPAVPFVHAHQQNEELYGILSGAGEIWLDGEVIALRAGDWLRVAPAAKRAIRALPTEAMRFICIQTKCGSLEGFTMTDGIPCEEKAPWH